MPIIVEHLSYIYKAGTPMAKQALVDVSLTIEDGEYVGLIGHTGSGKSTLIQHFNGLLRPTSGTVVVDGVNVAAKGVERRQIRQKVGMVFQFPEHQLFGETVFEDVGFGPKNLGIKGDELVTRVRESLQCVELNYEQLQHRSPFELSGGQKRRVAIAGVLAMRPRVLILDEPTAGLDPRGRDEILSQVSQLHRSQGLTVILVSHSMEDIANYAHRLLVIERGKIVMQGSRSQVFSQVETLEKMGLGVPQVTKLMYELKARGCRVRTDVFTLDQAEKELNRMLENTHEHV